MRSSSSLSPSPRPTAKEKPGRPDLLLRLGITNVQGPLIKVGNLEAVVEDRIIISSVERIVLDIENFLLTKERKIFGTLEDVFGQVERPLYSVLNDQYVKDLFTEGKVKLGDPIFCLSSVMKELNEDRINELKQRKGCDASNKFDEEPLGHRDGEDIYFSDDDLETSTQHRPRKEFIGKRDRELDEEEWSRNKMNKAKVQDLKQKYSNQPPQNQNFQAPTQGLHEYQSHHPSMGHSIAQPAHLGPSQGNVPPQYSNYMAPIIPQLTPEQVLSYNHYLAQINMMYGLPPFAQNNYVQSLNPQPTYLPQDPTQQYSPDFYQNPNQSQQ
jgi:rRNA processing protein Gar1